MNTEKANEPRKNPTYTKEHLGKRLFALRKERNLSQYEFASKANIRDKAYTHYEKGRANITLDNLLSIVNMHDISLEGLFLEEKELKE